MNGFDGRLLKLTQKQIKQSFNPKDWVTKLNFTAIWSIYLVFY